MNQDLKDALMLRDGAKPTYVASVYAAIGAVAFWLLTK